MRGLRTIEITHRVTNDLSHSLAARAADFPGFAAPARAFITHKETNDFVILFPSGKLSSFSLGKIPELTDFEASLCNLFIYNRLRSFFENYPPSHDWFPPFGIDWKREKDAVEAEHERGEQGRFAAGLPKISDGQQLFVLNGLSKLESNGKMAIIQNGSPLFSGDAESGPSEIRRYILENDWLDAIIQLSTDQFMNTGIATYVWVLSKDKPANRAGKVQLIDASHCYEPRRKSIGTKRNDITDKCRELIVRAYGQYENDAIYGDENGIYCESKIFDTADFGYSKIVVERPQKDEEGNILLKKGKPVADKELRDTENVPMKENIDDYFKREVLPYAPDAWIDKNATKIGYEIPMTRYFYKYQVPESVESIQKRISEIEKDITSSLNSLFGK